MHIENVLIKYAHQFPSVYLYNNNNYFRTVKAYYIVVLWMYTCREPECTHVILLVTLLSVSSFHTQKDTS